MNVFDCFIKNVANTTNKYFIFDFCEQKSLNNSWVLLGI